MPSRTADSSSRPPSMHDTHDVSGLVLADESVFAEEKRRIFDCTWHLACHESEISQAFDFRTVDYVGTPLIVFRGADRQIRTFLNVCAHRGAKIIHEVSGNARRLTCFYHMWSYDDRGACVDIPRPEGYLSVGLEKEDVGLREVRTECHLGLVFISLDDEAMPLRNYIGSGLDAFGGAMAGNGLEVFQYRRAVIDASWKSWLETSLDIYHELMQALLCRTQLTAVPLADRKLTVHPHGHTSVAVLRAQDSSCTGMTDRADNLALPTLQSDDVLFGTIFPHLAFHTRGTTMRIDVVTPIDARRTLVEWRGLGVRGDTAANRSQRIRHHNQYWGPFGRDLPEDACAVETGKSGSGPATAQRQVIAGEEQDPGQDDGMLRAFHAEWSRRMDRPASEPSNRRAR